MNKTNDIGSLGVALCLVGTVGFSILVFFSFLSSFNHATDSSHWPHVNGVVVANSSVRSEGGIESACYEYLIDGKTYHACQENFFQADALSKGQIGQTVKVFYNPHYPQDACLIPGVSSITTTRIVVFLTILLGADIIIIYSLVKIGLPKKNRKVSGTRVERERGQAFTKLNEWSHN